MNTISREQLIQQLNWRYATKQYDPNRKISSEDWAALEEAMRLTPSSYGLPSWKAVVVTDPEVRRRLQVFAFDQSQVTEASHLVIFAAKKQITEQEVDEYLNLVAEIRSTPRTSLQKFREALIGGVVNGMDEAARRAWAARQAYIGLGNFINSAALLGIDASPMEGFLPDEFDRVLGLDKHGLHAVVMVAAGYRAETDKYATLTKVRPAKEDFLMEV
ncbi:MAG TPA: NAD(P)H-dependent oxidoreductase [Methylomirabilota bacterium]|nr:NAD(P)H-dependent oxidoreductase [Methylomirabilota bacterium]